MPTIDRFTSTIQEMGDAITSSRPESAIDIGQAYLDHMMNRVDSAEFYFLMSTAHRLTGSLLQAEGFRERARRSSDYSPLIRGDFSREEILIFLGWGNPHDEAMAFLFREVRELHADDYNRLAALDTTEGMLHYAVGNFLEAQECFRRAAYAWRELAVTHQPYDAHWRRHNRFHRMRVAARLGDNAEARHIARKIVRDPHEKDEARLNAARLIGRLPSLGVRVVDRMYH